MAMSKPQRRPRFIDWLIQVLDENFCLEDATWIDRTQGTAFIRWPHKSPGTWSIERDAKLFRMWAIESGKFRPGIDKPNPKSWKCNFRMNLNISPAIKELKELMIAKGPNACRIFRFQNRRMIPRSTSSGEFNEDMYYDTVEMDAVTKIGRDVGQSEGSDFALRPTESLIVNQSAAGRKRVLIDELPDEDIQKQAGNQVEAACDQVEAAGDQSGSGRSGSLTVLDTV